MTDIFAICDGCSKKYRVPSAERTYSCKSCTGRVRPIKASTNVHVGSGLRAGPAPRSTSVARTSPKAARPQRQGPGLVQRLMTALTFWKREEESDAVSGATTLESMDWDVFGADPLADSTDPMTQPSLLPGTEAMSPDSDKAWREGATAPRVPVKDDFSPQGSPDSVRSAFNDFDWD